MLRPGADRGLPGAGGASSSMVGKPDGLKPRRTSL